MYFYNIERDYSHNPGEFQSHYGILTKEFPFLKGVKVTHQWGGRIGITLDWLPSIGRTGQYQNVYYSMGYNGHGDKVFKYWTGVALLLLFAYILWA